MKKYKVTVYSGNQEYHFYHKGKLWIKENPAHYEIHSKDEDYYYPIDRTVIKEVPENCTTL